MLLAIRLTAADPARLIRAYCRDEAFQYYDARKAALGPCSQRMIKAVFRQHGPTGTGLQGRFIAITKTDSFCTAIYILGCYQEKKTLNFRNELCRFTNINVRTAGIALNS
jgi:hypothetical protein